MRDPIQPLVKTFSCECPHCRKRVDFMHSGSPELTREEVETLVFKTDLGRVAPELYRRLYDAMHAPRFDFR